MRRAPNSPHFRPFAECSWPQKFALDLWYIDNHSLWLDLKIIALTLWRVVQRQGILAPGEAAMAKFTGNPP